MSTSVNLNRAGNELPQPPLQDKQAPTTLGNLAGHVCTLGSYTLRAASIASAFVALVGAHNCVADELVKNATGREFLNAMNGDHFTYSKLSNSANSVATYILTKAFNLYYGTGWSTGFGATNIAKAIYYLGMDPLSLVIGATVTYGAMRVGANLLSAAANYYYGTQPEPVAQ